MKALLLVLTVLFSVNSFSVEVGEDQKGKCIYADQSANRDAKVVVTESEEKKEENSSVSK